MSDLIQKAIDQTERAKYGLCCEEAVHALDIANQRIEELEAQLIAERAVNAAQVRDRQAFQSRIEAGLKLAGELSDSAEQGYSMTSTKTVAEKLQKALEGKHE